VRRLGAQIVEFDYDPFRRTAEMLYEGPWVAERLEAAGPLFRERPGELRPELRAILGGATRYTALDVYKANYQLACLRRQADKVWQAADVLLLPTTGTIYTIAEIEADPLRLNRNLGYYTNFVNLLDLSAVAVPNGRLASGLPMGVTFIGRAFDDVRLLQLGAAFHRLSMERTLS
jgi:allophanate hydrolase